MKRRKRHQFPRNRWIRVGQVVRTARGSTAIIRRVDHNGVTVGAADWSCTWFWCCVFRERNGLPSMTEVWRPVCATE